MSRTWRRLHGEASIVTLGRFGHWLPRASPPAVLLAAAGGKAGLVVLHLLLAGAAVFAGTRLLALVAPASVAAVAVAGATLVAPLREAVLLDGPGLLAAASGLAALFLAIGGRWVAAGALAALSA